MKKIFLSPLLEEAPTSWALIRALEAEALQNAPFKNPILELGCGDGLFSKVLLQGKKTIDLGIDKDLSEIFRARRTGVYTQLIHCDATNLPIKNSSFKTLFSNGVLEHIPKLRAVLQEAQRILKKHGYLIFTCPTWQLTENLAGVTLLNHLGLSQAASRYGSFFNRKFFHYNLYDESEWKKILQKHGFILVSCTYYNPKLVTRIHELFLPSALASKLAKKLFNTQVFAKKLRRMLYLSWFIPVLLLLPVREEDKSQSSIAVVAKKI